MEILLITSRETRRFVIPKGWPMKGLAPNMAAMREAYEEARVEGYGAMAAIGAFSYDKRKSDGQTVAVVLDVYPLQVSIEHEDWPEMDQREKHWLPQATAAQKVDEPGLQALIRDFDPFAAPPRKALDVI